MQWNGNQEWHHFADHLLLILLSIWECIGCLYLLQCCVRHLHVHRINQQWPSNPLTNCSSVMEEMLHVHYQDTDPMPGGHHCRAL